MASPLGTGEPGEPTTAETSWKHDIEFVERTITRVVAGEEGWNMLLSGGTGIWCSPNDQGIEPHVGDTVRLFGKGLGHHVRGLVINSQVVYYAPSPYTPSPDPDKQQTVVLPVYWHATVNRTLLALRRVILLPGSQPQRHTVVCLDNGETFYQNGEIEYLERELVDRTRGAACARALRELRRRRKQVDIDNMLLQAMGEEIAPSGKGDTDA